jgi:hypothetical protein
MTGCKTSELHPVLSAFINFISCSTYLSVSSVTIQIGTSYNTFNMFQSSSLYDAEMKYKARSRSFVAFRFRGLFFAIIYGSFNKNALSSCSHLYSLLSCSIPHRYIFRGLNNPTCLLDHSSIKNEGKQEEQDK